MAPQGDLSEGQIHAGEASSPLISFLVKRERAVIAVLCALAAVRVFFFAAAFPFFNIIDEQSHFGTVVAHTRGHSLTPNYPGFDREAAELIVNFQSFEALNSRAFIERSNIKHPMWCIPPDGEIADLFAKAVAGQMEKRNVEAHAPPLYYLIAGGWYEAGKSLGIKGLPLLYWLRFFNLIPYALLVFLSYLLARDLFPGNLFIRFIVPLLTAFFPQDVFFGVHREVLSAPLATLTLLLLLRIYRSESRSVFLYLMAGVCAGGACLIDITNLVLAIPLTVVLFVRLKRIPRGGRAKEILKAGGLLLTMMIPVSWWLFRNYLIVGDLMASKAKAEFLGWTVKPLGQWFAHPFFSPGGFFYFFDEVMKNFWRGEYYWYGVPLVSPEMDFFYTYSSYICLFVCAANFLIPRGNPSAEARWIEIVCLMMFAASVLFLLVISLPYDFGRCFYPSRALPYFVSGRIISGTIVPFLIVYARGLEIVLARFKQQLNPLVVVMLIAVVITFSEIYISQDVYGSGFNFFTMISSDRSCP